VYVLELTTADTVEEKCNVFLKYVINTEGNWYISSLLMSLYGMLPHPCPRRKRAWEWDRLQRIVDFEEMSELEVLDLRKCYCRFLGPNGYNSSVSYDEIIELFGAWFKPGVLGNDVKVWCEECLDEFEKLSSSAQVFWEVSKWLYSGVPRPEFLVILLLMFQVISVVELGEEEIGDFLVNKDMPKVEEVFVCLGLHRLDFSYLKSQLSYRRIVKVFLHGFVKEKFDPLEAREQQINNKVRESGLQFVHIFKEKRTEEDDKKARDSLRAYKRNWLQQKIDNMTPGTWL